MDQISLFAGGRITDYAGAFVQGTFDGVDQRVPSGQHRPAPDRAVQSWRHASCVSALDINNGPTVQDPFNSTYAWGYPYVASILVPTPTAQPLLAGGLIGNSIGATVYAWYDRSLYLEAGLYNTYGPSLAELYRQCIWAGRHRESGTLSCAPPMSGTGTASPPMSAGFSCIPTSIRPISTFASNGSCGPGQLHRLRSRWWLSMDRRRNEYRLGSRDHRPRGTEPAQLVRYRGGEPSRQYAEPASRQRHLLLPADLRGHGRLAKDLGHPDPGALRARAADRERQRQAQQQRLHLRGRLRAVRQSRLSASAYGST